MIEITILVSFKSLSVVLITVIFPGIYYYLTYYICKGMEGTFLELLLGLFCLNSFDLMGQRMNLRVLL